jgi:RimJ/RimL family protein N-acetyltransferase
MIPYVFAGPIATERLVLRLLHPDDVDDVHSYQGRADVCEYLLYDAKSREKVAEDIDVRQHATTLGADGDYWQLAIELPATADSPSRVIGDLYFSLKSVENSGGEIGWVFNPDVHGNGYATEAASAVLDIVFTEVGLHRVIAELDPRNDASIALCSRLGMREEAFFVKDLRFRGDWADTGIYAILETEWAAR